jgi:hypothetical protein
MKSLMAIILVLLSLASTIDAEGNSNIANVFVADNMAGQIMTNADFAQVSNIEADLDGNSIHADQISNMEAIDNILTGSLQDDKTFFIQSVDQSISDKGNSNMDTQIIGAPGTGTGSFDSGLIAVGNTLTDSASSQMISQSEMVEGNSNNAMQNVGVPGFIGGFESTANGDGSFDSGLIAVGNTLADSVSSQMIRQNEIVEGNSNNAIQNVGVPGDISVSDIVTGDGSFDSGLIAVGNTLADSASSQMISQSEMVEGNSNNAMQNVCVPGFIDVFASTATGDGSFDSGLIAVGNTLTDSASSQMIRQNEIVEGNCNNAMQNVGVPGFINVIASTATGDGSFDSGLIAVGNILTDSAYSQMINQSEIVEGNCNNAMQNVGVPGYINVFASTATGDDSFDSGLIAVGNTLTDSVSNQSIRQKEIVEGNSNNAIQNVGVPDLIDVEFDSTVTGDGSFDSGLVAVGNTLTDSASSQMIRQKEIVEGNSNEATQIANSVMTTDILTRSHALQVIDEGALTVGSFNTIYHNGNLTSTANTVTDGSILQHTDIFSSS